MATNQGAAPSDEALSCADVSVSFGDVRALREVSLRFERRRLHVLVGQNGAGKSTLARVFAGLVTPDTGQVSVAGTPVTGGHVGAARRAGLEMVHQSFTLPPSMTVAESLELFRTGATRWGLYRRGTLNTHWHDALKDSGLDIDPNALVRDLPVESLQAVEITRALSADARVLLLDEPTAVLPPPAIERLFGRLRVLRDAGVTVITVLHKLGEVAALAETVTVLRSGRVVLPPTPIEETTERQLRALIVGEQASSSTPRSISPDVVSSPPTTRVLDMSGVTSEATATEPGLDDVTMHVEAGEIVGIAGVEGNGQRALVTAITGLQRLGGGTIELAGSDVTGTDLPQRRRVGLRLVPFERNTQGVSQSSSLWHNVGVLGTLLKRRSRHGLLNVGGMRVDAAAALDRWQVRYADVEQRAGELSGGNVQRLILARELSEGVSLLIAAQPTRGLDVAATDFVRSTLRELRASGSGVLLVSSDLDELFELSDRVVVMLRGRIVAAFDKPFELAAVGDAMVGVTPTTAAGT